MHLTAWYPCIDETSGVFILQQAKALQSIGLRVGLVFSRIEGLTQLQRTSFWKGVPQFSKTTDPVPTTGFKSWSLPGAKHLVSHFNRRMLINRYLAYERWQGTPDVLHSHVALETGLATQQIARRRQIPYVITEHSSEVLNGIACSDRVEKARKVYSEAECVIAVSEVLGEQILQISPDANVRIIGNMVGAEVFKLQATPRLESGGIIIVSVGSLTINKRYHDAIDALSRLPRDVLDRLEYRIIGEGVERHRLEKLVQSTGVQTTFLGNLMHREAMLEMAQADIFLHPSAYETFGIVAAEAMSLGIPIVATRCGGLEKFVTNEVGTLVDVGDVEDLHDALSAMINDFQWWKGRKPSIAHLAELQFHEQVVATKLAEIYR